MFGVNSALNERVKGISKEDFKRSTRVWSVSGLEVRRDPTSVTPTWVWSSGQVLVTYSGEFGERLGIDTLL